MDLWRFGVPLLPKNWAEVLLIIVMAFGYLERAKETTLVEGLALALEIMS